MAGHGTSERRGGWIKGIPNALTIARIGLASLVFFILAWTAGVFPGQSAAPDEHTRTVLLIASFVIFAVAAITDYFDGYLARKLNATSPWGVILDPIADKIAIAAAILGLVVLEPSGAIAIPGFVILFREMFVSGMREGLAPRGIKLPVTMLAKWKTTVQLVALSLEMLAAITPDGSPARTGAHALLAVAALLTLWTGWEYVRGAARALRAP
jgi:CDP-diacylglycerol--glycerol-3-phosphate 3-phosphatidyltransferase